jgi:hypothetical protein
MAAAERADNEEVWMRLGRAAPAIRVTCRR